MRTSTASIWALGVVALLAPARAGAQEDPYVYEETRSIREYYGPVGGARFLPNGGLVTCGKDKVVRVWDARQKIVHELRGHSNWATRLVVNADRTRAASIGLDGFLNVWDVKDGSRVFQVSCSGNIHNPPLSVAYHPTQERIAVGLQDGRFVEFDIASGRPTLTVRVSESAAVQAIAYRHDGSRIAAGAFESIFEFDASNGQRVETYGKHDSSDITALAYSPDGTMLASGATDTMIAVWDLKRKERALTLIDHSGAIVALAFDGSSKRLASCGEDAVVLIWDAEIGEIVAKLEGHGNSNQSVDFSRDGARILTAGMDGTCRIWTTSDGKQEVVMRPHGGTIYSVAFTPDGRSVAAAGQEYTVKMWNTEDGKLEKTLTKGFTDVVYRLSFSKHRSGDLAASYKNGNVKLWGYDTGTLQDELVAHRGEVAGIAYLLGGRLLVTGGEDSYLHVWNLGTKERIRTVGHDSEVRAVAAHPRSIAFASGDEAGIVVLWKVEERKKAVTMQEFTEAHTTGVASLDFNPEGTLLASCGTDGSVRILDAKNLKRVHAIESSSPATAIIFHPDGKYLATGHRDKSARIWKIGEKDPVHVLEGHKDEVTSLAYSPDGDWLATATWDGEIKLWRRKAR